MSKEQKTIIKKARETFKNVDIEALLDEVCRTNQLCFVCRTKKLKEQQEFCKGCKSLIKEISRDMLTDQEDA